MTPSELAEMQKKEKQGTHKLDLGHGFREFVARDSNNKFDRGIKFSGITSDEKQKLIDLLFKSEFNETLKKLGRELSLHGKDWGLISFIVDGKPFISFGELYSYKKIAGVVRYAYIPTEDVYQYDGESYPVLVAFNLINGKVVKSEGVYINSDWLQLGEQITYPGKVIPVWPFKNNALSQPDIIPGMQEALKEMDYYGKQLGVEYEKVKTQFINNLLFGSTKDGEEWQKDQQNGKAYIHDVNSPDGKLQGSLTPLISGSSIGQQVMQQIQYIEDKVLKYSMLYRETMGAGKNKHNLEVSMENQQAFEYMMNKIEFRQEQLTRFFRLVGAQLNINTDKLQVKLQISELEQNKIDMMNATIREMKAKAIQAEGTGANQSAMGKAVVSQPTQVEGE